MAANPGRNSHLPRGAMQWQSTVGHLMKHGARVSACCSACGLWKPVDLIEVSLKLGEETSLWNRRQKCKTEGCTGSVFFHASAGEGTPSRPLRD